MVPRETAAVSAHVLRARTAEPYIRLRCHFIESHIVRVHECFAVTCHLHFWQNDRDFYIATAVTRGWKGCRNKSQHRKLAQEKKNSPTAPAGTRTQDPSITSPAF